MDVAFLVYLKEKHPHVPVFVSKKSCSAPEIGKNHGGGCLKKKTFLSLKKVPPRLRLKKIMLVDVSKRRHFCL